MAPALPFFGAGSSPCGSRGQGRLCWLRGWSRGGCGCRTGLEVGKPQPSVTISGHSSSLGFLPQSFLPCQPRRQREARVVPSSAAAPVQSPKALDALSSVSLQSQHKSHCWQALPFCLCCYFLFVIKQCGKEARRPRGGGAETRSLI